MISQVLQNIFDLSTPSNSNPAADTAGNEPAPAPFECSQPPWILHVEDDEEFSMAIKTRLEAHGVAVVRADNGTKGYRTAFLRPPGAIILDIEMPHGQGDYVLRRLKESPLTADIPVIVLTGRKDKPLERKMLNLGAAAYLTKPVDMRRLLNELSRYIELLPEPVLV